MRNYPVSVTLPYIFERPTPPFEGNDIRYPESLVRYFMQAYSKKGARVFDPFAGLGTTLFVAEELGRKPFGMEADANRHAWAAGQLENWASLMHGDAAKINRYDFPKMDFCMTSPPFMPKTHKWNPLFAGNPKHAGYDKYLKQMGCIFALTAALMKPNAVVAVQADNLAGRIYTPLVADLQAVIAQHLTPVGETIVQWQKPKPDYPHTHVLLFAKK